MTEQQQQKRKPKNPIKFQIQLKDEQKEAKALIVENDITVLTGQAGSGKAQPLDSLVYTPTGPVKMGDVKVGDKVLGLSGTTEVIGVYPQGVEDIYNIELSDGSTVRASLGHLWQVQAKRFSFNETDNWCVKTTGELLEDLDKGIEYRIPRITEASFEEQELPLDPYLLGILLAEGHLTESSVSFSTNESTVLSNISDILEKTECTYTHIGNYDYRIKKKQRDNKPNSIVLACRELGVTGKISYDKFIPSIYKYSSIETRTKLIQGLVDGDGYVNTKGTLVYGTSSEVLAKDITEIFQSLGGRVTMLDYFPKYDYLGEKKTSIHKHYQLSITVENPARFTTIPFKRDRLLSRIHKIKYLSRVIKKITKVSSQETQCIKVAAEDSLYITDNFTVTHNTLVACQAALDALFNREVEKIIVARPVVTAKEEIGFLPGGLKDKLDPFVAPVFDNLYRLYNKEKVDSLISEGIIEVVPIAFMRGRNFSNSFVILDEAQNITDSQLELIVGRLCIGSKMVISGDVSQIDLKNKKESGLFFFIKAIAGQVPGVVSMHLKTNHRHPIIAPILEIYKTLRD